MNKGFVIMAQGAVYEKCALALERNIKQVMPGSNVTIITTDMLPYGDQAPSTNWKLQNDWQVYECSPYEYTIKIEADMYIPQSIDYLWGNFKERDLVICTKIRNFKQEISPIRTYRGFIDENKLPDCYNALTYFKKSTFAQEFFQLVRTIFENWDEVRKEFKCNVDEPATTDWVYAIASHVLGVEKTTGPQYAAFSMVHMKQAVNKLSTKDWTDTLIYEILPHTLRINSIPQMYPFHYHVKSFADEILKAQA